MPWQSNAQLLDDLFTGTVAVDAALVARVLAEEPAEDIHLDYKHGDFLKDKQPTKKSDIRKATERLRAFVSSFANSDGGVLVVGIVGPDAGSQCAPPWTLTGLPTTGGPTVEQWVGDVLRPIAPHFSVPPKHWVVSGAGGDVLVLAVRRSDELVPVTIDGATAYFLRVGDGSSRVPDYLVADLVLGRRSRAVLELTLPQHDTVPLRYQGTPPDREALFRFVVAATNVGLSWADDPFVGMIGIDACTSSPSALPQNLADAIEFVGSGRLVHHGRSLRPPPQRPSIEPFATTAPIEMAWRIPNPGNGDWYGAAYLLARNAPPRWYQVVARRREQCLDIELSPMSGSRPVVKWDAVVEVGAPDAWTRRGDNRWVRRDGVLVEFHGSAGWTHSWEGASTTIHRNSDSPIDQEAALAEVDLRFPMLKPA